MNEDGENRICYYVESSDRGWAVRFDHSNEAPQSFDNRERALNAARDAAEARWAVFGLPSCVKVRGADGSIQSDAHFG